MDNVERTGRVPRRWRLRHTLSSVRGRIIVGFAFLVLILVAVAAGSAWQVREHKSDTAAMAEHADTAFMLQNALVNAEAAASGAPALRHAWRRDTSCWGRRAAS